MVTSLYDWSLTHRNESFVSQNLRCSVWKCRFDAFSCFVSFILNGVERLRHASTCWHSFVYSERPYSLWVELKTLLLLLSSWRIADLVFKWSFQTHLYFWSVLLTVCWVISGLYMCQRTRINGTLQRATTVDVLSERKRPLLPPRLTRFKSFLYIFYDFFGMHVAENYAIITKTPNLIFIHKYSFTPSSTSSFRAFICHFYRRFSAILHFSCAVMNEWALLRMRQILLSL